MLIEPKFWEVYFGLELLKTGIGMERKNENERLEVPRPTHTFLVSDFFVLVMVIKFLRAYGLNSLVYKHSFL